MSSKSNNNSKQHEVSGRISSRLEILRNLVKSIAVEIEELSETQPRQDTNGHDRFQFSLDEQLRKFEFELIRYALFRSGGRQNKAAEMLKVKPTTLNWKIKRYNISFDGTSRIKKINNLLSE